MEEHRPGGRLRLSDIGPGVFEHRGAGQHQSALDRVEDAFESLHDDDLPTATFWRICLLNRVDRPGDAVAALTAALDRGWWYGEQMLRGDDDLATLQGNSNWEPLVIESIRRQLAAADIEPECEFRKAAAEPAGTVVALHAGGGRVRHTAEVWASILNRGYDLMVPGSRQRISHDRANWNDRETAFRDIIGQVEPRLRSSRLVLVGRSQGAVRAAELAAGPWREQTSGLVLVALAPRADNIGEVSAAAFCIVGDEDRADSQDRLEAFAARQRAAARPIRVARIAGMGHNYPREFAPLLQQAMDWLDSIAP